MLYYKKSPAKYFWTTAAHIDMYNWTYLSSFDNLVKCSLITCWTIPNIVSHLIMKLRIVVFLLPAWGMYIRGLWSAPFFVCLLTLLWEGKYFAKKQRNKKTNFIQALVSNGSLLAKPLTSHWFFCILYCSVLITSFAAFTFLKYLQGHTISKFSK